ncbi:MAG: TIGR04150 pseudo-rSAM protein [bacterium]|nr:TIGR04150 pseudo-rSAM protein [bacterium]
MQKTKTTPPKGKNKSASSWLFLHPFVHVTVKKSHALLYNTLTGERLEYLDDPAVLAIVRRLKVPRNCYVVRLAVHEIDESVALFIRRLRETYMGDTVSSAVRPKKPVQLYPLLGLVESFEVRDEPGEERMLAKDDIGDYLNTLTLYVNGDCPQKCAMCADAYRQFQSCRKGTAGKMLTPEDIRLLKSQLRASALEQVVVCGGNLLAYAHLPELIKELNTLEAVPYYAFHYMNIVPGEAAKITPLLQGGKIEVSVNFPLDRTQLERAVQWDVGDVPKRFRFVVESERHLDEVEEVVGIHGLTDVLVLPYFNGANRDFFQANVFSDRQSIFAEVVPQKEILARQAVNTTYFKQLTVLNDGRIYANVNMPCIGKLGKEHIFDILYRQLNEGRSWTKVRKHVSPCRSCLYCSICPPIGNYEYALGRYDLCNITPGER